MLNLGPSFGMNSFCLFLALYPSPCLQGRKDGPSQGRRYESVESLWQSAMERAGRRAEWRSDPLGIFLTAG
jgi:hypothetical protein